MLGGVEDGVVAAVRQGWPVEAPEHGAEAVGGLEMRDVAIMFCDIRNFSGLAENLDPQELTGLLNAFLAPMSEIILARRGTIEAQVDAARALAASADKAATIIRARASNGIDSDLAALDAERTVYAAQQTLVATRLARATNMAALYAVLGGGLKP